MATSSQGGVRGRIRWRRGAVWVRVPTAALAVAIALAACGGGSSSTVNANHWAGQVCTSIVNWGNQLKTTGNNTGRDLTGANLGQIKTSLVNFYGGAVSSTDSMIAGVQAAGVPSVSNGQAISQGLVAGLHQIRSALAQAQTQAQALPTDNAAALNSGNQSLQNTITTAGNQVKTNLNSLNQRYASNELNAAFKNQAACQTLSKS